MEYYCLGVRRENKVLNNICKANNLAVWYVISTFRCVFEALFDMMVLLKAVKKCMVIRNYGKGGKKSFVGFQSWVHERKHIVYRSSHPEKS